VLEALALRVNHESRRWFTPVLLIADDWHPIASELGTNLIRSPFYDGEQKHRPAAVLF